MDSIKNLIKNKRSDRTVRLVAVIVGALVVAAVLFFAGVAVGYHNIPQVDKVAGVFDKQVNIASTTETAQADADFGLFWKAWNILNSDYVNPSAATTQQKVYGAIEGLAQSYGDPYTVFMPPQEASDFNSEISGNFGGVGIELGIKNSNLVVIAPLKGTPADQAGIKAGDYILDIDGTSTQNMDTDTAVDLIRGVVGTKVTLTMLRANYNANQSFKVTLTRATINAPEVDDKLLPDGIYQISLYTFTENSPTLFANALQRFANSGSNKLIIDLRGNPGGYLDAAVDMASWFLPPGKTVVSENYGGKQPVHEDVTTHNEPPLGTLIPGLQVVILVDGGSASASEIFSGAMQEYGVAKLVGEQTFGKGSVQEVVNLTPDTNLKVTIAKWFTPNGTSISEKGITPDYVVPITQADVDNGTDPQLAKAEALLLAGDAPSSTAATIVVPAATSTAR